MTPEAENLRKLAIRATPGPWIKTTRFCEAMISTKKNGLLFPALGNSEGAHADAEYIAAANPKAILALTDEIARLTRELRHIAEAKPSTWDDPDQFQPWAQNRARHAILAPGSGSNTEAKQ